MKYPVEYRSREMEAVFRSVVNGDCAMLVGIGSVGKTHLLQHFTTHKNVQTYYLEQYSDLTADNVLFVRVDPNGFIIPPSESKANNVSATWLGFELMMRSLIDTVQEQHAISETQRKFLQKTYDSIFDENRRENLRIFPRFSKLIKWILENLLSNGRIVFVIDEAEYFMQLSLGFFLNLRSIRDWYRTHSEYHVMFIMAARQDLTEIIPTNRQQQLEPYIELFQNSIYINQMNDADFKNLLKTVSKRLNLPSLPDKDQKELYHITQGHGGLVRAALVNFGLIANLHKNAGYKQILLQDRMRRECERMHNSLSTREQQLLKSLVAGHFDAEDTQNNILVNVLRAKGILTEDTPPDIIPPLFGEYVRGVFTMSNRNSPQVRGDMYSIDD